MKLIKNIALILILICAFIFMCLADFAIGTYYLALFLVVERIFKLWLK